MSYFEERRSVVRPRKVNGKGTAGEECLKRLKGVIKHNFECLEQDRNVVVLG